jgi:hypothetical protein
MRDTAAQPVRDIALGMGDVIRCLTASGAWPGAQMVRPPAQGTSSPQDVSPAAWRLPLPEAVRRSLESVEGD